MYFINFKCESESQELETIPLGVLDNSLPNESEQYLVSVLDTGRDTPKDQMQLLINSVEAGTTVLNCTDGKTYKINQMPNPSHLNNETSCEVTLTVPIKQIVVENKVLSESTPLKKTPRTKQLVQLNSIKPCQNGIKDMIEKQHIKMHDLHISDQEVPQRAYAVLPTALILRQGKISPRRMLPARVRFGPVQGITHKILNSEASKLALNADVTKSPIFLMRKSTDSVTYIDVSDKDKANWLSLLPLGDQSTANVWLYEEDNELYGITTETIPPRTPLALGYSKQYAADHGLSLVQPVLDLTEALSGARQWWCYECPRAVPSAALLQRHMEVHHKEVKHRSRYRYRCRYCLRTFSRLFTLKRHTSRYCSKKPEKIEPSVSIEREDATLNSTQYMEENKLPSDESLQNYTNNILDFSTNLFDTDRLPNLDISGSSKSDGEFNSYSISYKDDSCLTSELGFTKTTNLSVGNQIEPNMNKQQEAETSLSSCPQCSQTIVRGQQRQHMRECPSRRFECECGQVFSRNEKLAQHIYTEHPNNTNINQASKTDELQYKCEECQIIFKRRGMLVNHSWRVHRRAATVPLQRRERHYPCGACPKLYRTAAKRDRHLRNHHPGAERARAQSIEGGRRVCEPAACWACPRQYATRAKLLQHVRARHPQQAPPLKKNLLKAAS